MTQEQFELRLARAVEKAVVLMKAQSPVRTGELRDSIKLLATSTGYEIIVTAPHFGYTEGKWTHERWNWPNPNEGWWTIGVDLVMRLVQAEIGGSLIYEGSR